MVREIKAEEMKVATVAADALRDATRSGKGTPVEICCAEAVLEQARNTEMQAKAYRELADAVGESAAASKKAAEDALTCLEAVAAIDDRIVSISEAAIKRRLAEVLPTGACSIVDEANRKLGITALTASDEIEKAASAAARAIERSITASVEREQRARRRDWWHQLGIIGKIGLCGAMAATCLLLLFAGWRFLPAVTGEVQITYIDTYRSELDITKAELVRTQNEPNAYKDAYPEGLSEQRLHELARLNESS